MFSNIVILPFYYFKKTIIMWKNIFKEPLLHFLLIAILFFVIFDVLNPPTDRNNVINISKGRVEQLNVSFQKIWLRSPNDEELTLLIREYALDEIYNQEARALSLDKNDAVIKRRLRQKMEFMLQNTMLKNATQSEINNFYQENKEKYLEESRYSFEQIFISRERNKEDLNTIIEKQKIHIASGHKPSGDNTLLPSLLVSSSESDIERQFGTAFINIFIKLETGQWQGPLQSSLGWHFVNITSVEKGVLPELALVYDKVIDDMKYQQKREAKVNFETTLFERYEIHIEGLMQEDR
ncbi:MAG: hypothetical protein ACI89U_000904 [Gammaproteobacteria bacterium]